jgi:hypothetical protein
MAKKVFIRASLFKMPAFDAFFERCRADRSWETDTVTSGHDVMIDQSEVLTPILEKHA